MNEIPEELEDFLIEEKSWCLQNIRYLNYAIDKLNARRNEYQDRLIKWKDKHSRSDRMLAMATLLQVVTTKKKTKDPDVRALERVLKNPALAQDLIDLLKEN